MTDQPCRDCAHAEPYRDALYPIVGHYRCSEWHPKWHRSMLVSGRGPCVFVPSRWRERPENGPQTAQIAF